jgi:membrane-associated protease RseP (regulator of RpoE activity)
MLSVVTRSGPLLVIVLFAGCGGTTPAPAPPAPSAPPANAPIAQPPPTESRPGWLGVWFETGTTRTVRVVENGPAALAGIQLGDVIETIDGVAVSASREIVNRVTSARPGTKITVGYKRRGTSHTTVVELGTRPPDERLMRDAIVDQPAPDFTAPALDGSPAFKLADLRGNVILIDFWATWCGPCTFQFPHLKDWHQRYTSRGLRILALSDEEADLVRDFTRTEKLT